MDLTSTYLSSPGELVAMFRSRGIPPEEAQDLAHETILRVLVHVKRHGRTREDLGPLARTIARNLLVERLRKGRVRTVALSDAGDVADSSPDPFDQAVDTERREAVRTALRSLTPRHRRVVELWMQGRSPAEIARDLGIKRNAADALLHRARRTLASRLGPRTLWGAAALVYFRARTAVRQAARELASLSPTAATAAPAGATLIAVGLAAMISVPHHGAGDDGTDRLADHSTPTMQMHSTTSFAVDQPIVPDVVEAKIEVSRAQAPYTASAGARFPNPVSGNNEDDAGIDISYDPDAEGRGQVDSVLHEVLSEVTK